MKEILRHSEGRSKQPPLRWTKTPNVPSSLPPVPKNHSYINSAHICADGSKVIAANYFYDYENHASINAYFGTYCYDASGNLLWQHLPETEIWGGVYWAGISADGNFAASGGWCAPAAKSAKSKHTGFVQAFRVSDGERILPPYKTEDRVNMLDLSADGSVLVAGSNNVLLFQLQDDKYIGPTIHELEHAAPTISLSQDGQWFIVADYGGNVFLFQNLDGNIVKRAEWSSPVPGPFHAIQISADGEWIVIGGNDNDKYVYLFSRDKMVEDQRQNRSVTYNWRYELRVDGRAPNSQWGLVYGVAISPDGKYISVVGDGTPDDADAGEVYVLQNLEHSYQLCWQAPILRNVNSTSMDAAAQYVTVADGHPDGTPGHFYLFDRESGSLLWKYTTDNMSWPMFISADGSAIVAGSDNGNVYYFKIS